MTNDKTGRGTGCRFVIRLSPDELFRAASEGDLVELRETAQPGAHGRVVLARVLEVSPRKEREP